MTSTGNEIAVRVARSWIGTPYRHQASVRGVGADCLGLVRGVWRELCGAETEPVPGYTPDWSEAGGEEVLWAAAARNLRERRDTSEFSDGDVILFRMRNSGVAKHLGIAASRNGFPSFVHAYSGHGVVENALTRPWRRKIVAIFAFPERR